MSTSPESHRSDRERGSARKTHNFSRPIRTSRSSGFGSDAEQSSPEHSRPPRPHHGRDQSKSSRNSPTYSRPPSGRTLSDSEHDAEETAFEEFFDAKQAYDLALHLGGDLRMFRRDYGATKHAYARTLCRRMARQGEPGANKTLKELVIFMRYDGKITKPSSAEFFLKTSLNRVKARLQELDLQRSSGRYFEASKDEALLREFLCDVLRHDLYVLAQLVTVFRESNLLTWYTKFEQHEARRSSELKLLEEHDIVENGIGLLDEIEEGGAERVVRDFSAPSGSLISPAPPVAGHGGVAGPAGKPPRPARPSDELAAASMTMGHQAMPSQEQINQLADAMRRERPEAAVDQAKQKKVLSIIHEEASSESEGS